MNEEWGYQQYDRQGPVTIITVRFVYQEKIKKYGQ
jgi:hypothetical protein